MIDEAHVKSRLSSLFMLHLCVCVACVLALVFIDLMIEFRRPETLIPLLQWLCDVLTQVTGYMLFPYHIAYRICKYTIGHLLASYM